MQKTIKLEELSAIADEVDGQVYKNYSGRGMFGAKCVGITCSSVTSCIEIAAVNGLTGARWDQLGKSFIVYWPDIQLEEEC